MGTNMVMFFALAVGLSFSACSGGGSSGGVTSSSGVTISAVDGYIKNATVKDAAGQVAAYSGAGGKYTFASSVTYPLTLTGGAYEDTNASFDINMTAESGNIISPITTFIDGNSTLLGILANLGLSGSPGTYSDFAKDYIDTNSTDLAKLSQLLYVMEKNATLFNAFKARVITNNPSSLNELFTLCKADIKTTMDAGHAPSFRNIIDKIQSLNSPVSDYEKELQNYKLSLNYDLPDVTHNGITYGQVVSPYTGRIWLDRNLGASRVCTALDDTACYGDYYQWGRDTDGHQERNSTTTYTSATDINATNVNGKFITYTSYIYDWVASGGDDNGSLRSTAWSKTDGSSVCPAGYRVPTIDELKAETLNNSKGDRFSNNTDAFNSFLKFPSAGSRSYSFGSMNGQGSYGVVWSSSPNSSGSHGLDFDSGDADTSNYIRVLGFSVRCLKD